MKKKAVQFIAVAALSAAVTMSAVAAEEHSGFLGDYSKLAKEKDANGDEVLRYVNPKVKPGSYQKVLIDATQFYPAPKPTSQVGDQALTDIRNYMDKALREGIGGKLPLASEPGPGVVRIRPAITAVDAKNQGLKPYELLPVGFIISRGIVGKAKEATIELEVEVVDSVTGERLGAVVRKGVGAKIEDKDGQLSLPHIRPVLDKWVDTGSTFIAERIK
jgi:hypothetical protein